MASATIEFTKEHEHEGKIYGAGYRKAFSLGTASDFVGRGVARDVSGKLTSPSLGATQARFEVSQEVAEDPIQNEIDEQAIAEVDADEEGV